MKVGIIGLGSIGLRHARNAAGLGHVVGFCDPAPRAKDGFACALETGTLAGLLDWKPDAALICTPATTHADVAKNLLALGYKGALFIEKPIATRLEDCEVFRSWPHPTTMVGYNLRFHDAVRRMRGAVGGVLTVEDDMSRWPGKAYAEPLYEFSHEIDLACWLAELAGDTAALTVTLFNGVCVSLQIGRWAVHIDSGAAQYWRRWAADTVTGWRQYTFERPTDLGTTMYLYELAHFFDSAERAVATDVPFEDGIRVVSLIEEAKRMAACVS